MGKEKQKRAKLTQAKFWKILAEGKGKFELQWDEIRHSKSKDCRGYKSCPLVYVTAKLGFKGVDLDNDYPRTKLVDMGLDEEFTDNIICAADNHRGGQELSPALVKFRIKLLKTLGLKVA